LLKNLSVIEASDSNSPVTEIDLPMCSRELRKLVTCAEKTHENLLQLSQLSTAHSSQPSQEEDGEDSESEPSNDSTPSTPPAETEVDSTTEIGTTHQPPPQKAISSKKATFAGTRSNRTQQNVHAINVLKRVESKLEGRDHTTELQSNSAGQEGGFQTQHLQPPPRVEPQSVKDQVDRVIQQAINPDNLCLLYEGWTAWI
jgi:hypothetical protein